jgi:pimeloyl-ACP methyl ester carboxylesterase
LSRGARLAAVLALGCAPSTVLPAGAGAQSPALAFGACDSSQIVVPVAGLQCATLDVPLDRRDPVLGSVALAVQRVPASGPRMGVIVLLAGGPGQAALPAFELQLVPLAREGALRSFELVAFDQRGTGQSEDLLCPEAESMRDRFSSELAECGAALGPTRAFYASQESVEDLDALRQALGGMPLSLFAVSYGGRVAGMYAREHSQGVARMVLDSPEPLTGSDPLDSQRLRALPRVLDDGICGAGACRSFSGNVYTDVTSVVAKLHHHPLRTSIYNGHGRLVPVTVTETGVLGLLVGLDLSPSTRELAPAAIAAAAHGYVAPLARLTLAWAQAERPSSELTPRPGEASLDDLLAGSLLGEPPFALELPESENSLALFAATYCVENELPWSPESAPASRTATLRAWLSSLPAGSTAPFRSSAVVAESVLPLCLDWPATPAAPPSPTGVSATPTLILSGEDDLRTPYEQDLTVTAGYSDVQLLRIPDVGHSTVSTDPSGCAKQAMIEFLTSGHAPLSCPASKEPQALPLPPGSLSKVRPLPARSRLVGQVAAAVALTLEDFYGQAGTSGGGLRGGYWQITGTSVLVHDLVDVPDVAISGVIPLESTAAHFTVDGRLTGRLTQKGLTVTGQLDGTPIHLRLVAT